MRFYGSLCVLIRPCVFLWVLIDFDASLCVVMCPYWYLYVLMSSLWILVGPYGSL